MKYAWLGCLLVGGLLSAGTQDSDNLNVNTRYTVETVIVSAKSWRTDLQSESNDRISSGLRRDLRALIGGKVNPGLVDSLAARLRKEFSAHEVTHRLLRGDNPDSVRVEFNIKTSRRSLDVNVSQFLYNSVEGWSGVGEAGFTVNGNSLAFGLASDGDLLPERYAGISARYANRRLGSDRLGLRFEFESYHAQWNRATLDALAAAPPDTLGAYRSRQNFQPTAIIALAKPLTLEVGVRFERLEEQLPPARTDAANALTTTLRYHQRLEETDARRDLDASYALRAGTRVLGSDYAYTSHFGTVRYEYARGKHSVSDEAAAGFIAGRAPLDDRFILGNSRWLRGWNKYELDPLGGNRVVSNSVEYRYGMFRAFYDMGAIWDEGQAAVPHHALGVGLRESLFTLAVAFPVRSGHIEPIFMMGMIY
jgi:outer membrane protein assembly factor BamA